MAAGTVMAVEGMNHLEVATTILEAIMNTSGMASIEITSGTSDTTIFLKATFTTPAGRHSSSATAIRATAGNRSPTDQRSNFSFHTDWDHGSPREGVHAHRPAAMIRENELES